MVHYIQILYKGVVSMALGSITMASLRNMQQTFFITTTYNCHNRPSSNKQKNGPFVTSKDDDKLWNVSYKSTSSSDTIIHNLKQMSRKELLELFLKCEPPTDLNDVLGSWDGILLQNNLVLVSIYSNVTVLSLPSNILHICMYSFLKMTFIISYSRHKYLNSLHMDYLERVIDGMGNHFITSKQITTKQKNALV